jgi:hypothetical protein
MKDILSFPKIGNLKLGLIRHGKPIQTTRILVTLPTREGNENFKIFPGFNIEGEEKVNITLPFDDLDLNFEVNYVGFITVSKIDYIAKAANIGDKLFLFPLNPEDFNSKIIDAGELTEELIEKYNLVKTGFLKVMLENVSGFGEMFYFKTKSVNSIRAIKDQLIMLSSLTNGKIAGLPLVLKPVKKDVGENQIIFLSISYNHEFLSDKGLVLNRSLDAYLTKRESSKIDISKFEEVYKDSRTLTEDDIVSIETFDIAEIKVEKDTEKEINEILTEAQKADLTEDELYIHTFFEEKNIELPKTLGLAVFNSFNGDKEHFEMFITDETTPLQCVNQINKK